MKLKFQLIVIVTAILIGCKSKTNSNDRVNSLKNRLESYIVECKENGLSASILVAKDGEILYSGEVGLRNKAKNYL